ncbi:TetR/AcrR family transcriptional regulator [Dietzia sp. UBA5065]|uniref:TetR/AcrR family transcriptional regulator n=1 Tax=Dietzia sp. UBA5065 TaxID=1946422 RepID=UPI0025B7E8C4|nr:TetR/AcrR family transcriptional regulator [Dietzia sp. UBA5065]HMT49741.1 TetR family transcriptional regulator [Dietzia sp.]
MTSDLPLTAAAFLRAALDRHVPAATTDAMGEQIIDAAMRQFELFGVTRSTMGDITRRSGLSRMSLYRRFANKQELVNAVLLRESGRILAGLKKEIDRYDDVESKLTEGFLYTVDTLRGHSLLNRLLESEPEVSVPYLTVLAEPLVRSSAEFLASEMATSLDDRRTHEELLVAAEVAVRLVISFVLTPSTTIDLDDPDVARAFARTHLGPQLQGPRGRPSDQ